jgi:peptide/nickel transport system permease protein
MSSPAPTTPSTGAVLSEVRRGGPSRPAALRAIRRFGVVPALAVVVLVGFAVAALWPHVLAPGDPSAIDLDAALRPPSAEHPLGTDQSGRDLWTRVVHGTRESLTIGLGATGVAVGLAVVLGLAAGLGSRAVDRLIGAGLEVAFAFPTLLLALLLVAVRGPSPTTLVLAVGVGTAPGYARMVRGQVLAVRREPYVEAALALGHPWRAVIARHVLPNALRPLVALVTLGVGQSVVWASGLAFLGMGVAPPSPEWGALLEAGRMYVTHAWWLEVMPGLAIVTLAVAATSVGRAVQSRLEGEKS